MKKENSYKEEEWGERDSNTRSEEENRQMKKKEE